MPERAQELRDLRHMSDRLLRRIGDAYLVLANLQLEANALAVKIGQMQAASQPPTERRRT